MKPKFDKPAFNRELGLRIKILRQADRRTQKWVAAQVGVGRCQLANIEAGRSGVYVDLIWRLAIVLKRRMSDFVPTPVRRPKP